MPTTPFPTRRSFLAFAVLTASAVAVAASVADASEPVVARVSRPGGFAGSSGEAGPQGAEQVRLDVGPTLPGIDVSHWQGTIDWQRVAEKGKRFAFLKATDGHDLLDPTFFANRAGARANGLPVGAYHFARPDPSKGDAVEEARWFVSQADPRPGNLLPVLDLETSRGLDQQDVTLWARRWTAEVRRLTGVTPLVYTSPLRLGAPHRRHPRAGPRRIAALGRALGCRVTAAARRGVGRERLARVAVHEPRTGRRHRRAGSTSTSCGGTRSARSRSAGSPSRWRATPARSSARPAGLGCSSTCEKSVDPDTTVTLTARPDDGAYFTGWGGACSGTDETCTITMRGNRSVHATFVTDITAPVADVEVADGFRGPVVVAFDEPVRHVDAANVLLQRAGDDRVTVTRRCRSADGATVGCDGLLRSVMLTPSTPLVPGRDYEVLVDPPGADPVVDRVGNAAAALVHPFEAARSVEQGHAPVTLSPVGAWRRTSTSAASGDAFALSERAGSTVRIRFDGAGIDWVTVTGPNRGRARLLGRR